MSDFWKGTIELVAVVLILSTLIALFFGLSWIIGYTFQYFGFLKDMGDPANAGSMILFMASVLGVLMYWGTKLAMFLGTGITNVIVDRYNGTNETCRVFEECKED